MTNVVMLHGRLSSEPRATVLGSNTTLIRYEVTVPRPDEKADSVPVAWFLDEGAAVPALARGDHVVVVGRIHRRFWQTPTGVTASSTEVLALSVEPDDKPALAEAKKRAKAMLR
jgi:single-stranded DNA-binding protein